MSGLERAPIGSEEVATFEDLANLVITDRRRSIARSLVRAGVSEPATVTPLGHRTQSMFDRYDFVGHAGLACEQ